MHQVLMCTCPDQLSAKSIAKHLVTEKLVACVNIVPSISSVYLWKDELVTDNELLLMIKTTTERFNQVCDAIEQVHPYEVPEVIALDIRQGNKDYLDWIEQAVK
jgi:periplasmic divalent cation tolerance protein